MAAPDIFYKEAGGNQSTFDIFLFWNPPYFASNPHFAFDHVEWLKRSNMSPNTPKQERFWVTEIIIRTSLKIYIKLTKGRSHNKSQAEAKPSYIWSICPNSNSDPPPPPLLMASGHSFCSCGDRGGQSPFSQSEPVFSKCHRQMVPPPPTSACVPYKHNIWVWPSKYCLFCDKHSVSLGINVHVFGWHFLFKLSRVFIEMLKVSWKHI